MKHRVTLLALAALSVAAVVAYISRRQLTATPAKLEAEASAAGAPKSNGRGGRRGAGTRMTVRIFAPPAAASA
jgi:hypothetical protein